MATWTISGHTVYTDPHGYRTRLWSPTLGYIGSYSRHTKTAGYCSSDMSELWKVPARGPKTAAKICVERALVRKGLV